MTMCIWNALSVNAKRTKLLLTSTEKWSNHESQSEHQEKSHAKTIAWSYNMENNSVEWYFELANKTCLDDHEFNKEELDTVHGWRTVKSILSNCPDMYIFATIRYTRHLLVRKHSGTTCHKIDKSLPLKEGMQRLLQEKERRMGVDGDREQINKKLSS